jgi:hypothetical protein
VIEITNFGANTPDFLKLCASCVLRHMAKRSCVLSRSAITEDAKTTAKELIMSAPLRRVLLFFPDLDSEPAPTGIDAVENPSIFALSVPSAVTLFRTSSCLCLPGGLNLRPHLSVCLFPRMP